MTNRSTGNPAELVSNVIEAFLDAPPSGTPAEIVAAFNRFCGDGDNPLSGHLFFHMVEEAPIALSITDAKARILYANRKFEAVTGYPREEVIGQNQSILSNKATPKSVYESLWTTVAEGRTWHGTLVNRTRDGAAYLAELSISPVADHSGEIGFFLGMHRDISGMHELQQQVALQKGLLESILDTAPVVVALLDGERRVLLDNQEYKKLFGDLRGREPAEVLLKAVTEQAGIELPGAGGKGGDFRNVEVRLEFTSGAPRWFVCSVIRLDRMDPSVTNYFKTSGRESVCLLLANEITRQRREYERARMEHLRAGLAEQQRVSGMREALAAATFQIQQPLNLVNAASEMLRRSEGDQHHLLPILEQIGESAQRALDAFKAAVPVVDEEPSQGLNLNEILQEVLELATDDLLRNGIVIDWQPSPVLSILRAPPRQVRALLMNLVDNAVTALSESALTHKVMTVRTAESHEVLSVTIQDNGGGIAPGSRMNIFEPLFCGWQNKSGHAGMGLSMAQDIVSRHGGAIVIDDEFEQGCRVIVEFPLSR